MPSTILFCTECESIKVDISGDMIEDVKSEDIEALKKQLLSDFFDDHTECKTKGICSDCKQEREKIKALAEKVKAPEAAPVAQNIAAQIVNVTPKVEKIEDITNAIAKLSLDKPASSVSDAPKQEKPLDIVEKIKKIQENAAALKAIKKDYETLSVRCNNYEKENAILHRKIAEHNGRITDLLRYRTDSENHADAVSKEFAQKISQLEQEKKSERETRIAQCGEMATRISKLEQEKLALERENADLAAKLKQSEDTIRVISEFIKD